MDDVRTVCDMLLALLITEAIARPIARQIGKTAFRRLDKRLPWIPNWLHTPEDQ